MIDKIILLKKQGEETTEIENELDKHIYKIYGLTEEEIKIIENNECLD